MELTQVLQSAKQGNRESKAEVIEAAYEDLRRIAARKMINERQNHTFGVTELVNEVSIKILTGDVPVESRGQFFAYASKAMRSLLIDHARTQGRQKRGGERKRFTLDEAMTACDERRDDFLALDQAIQSLSNVKPRAANVVEMRYFGGMSNQEIATALDISLATVKREWIAAKAWLLRVLLRPEAQCV